MPKTPDYGDELDFGGGVVVPRPADPPKSSKPIVLEAEDFMGGGDDAEA